MIPEKKRVAEGGGGGAVVVGDREPVSRTTFNQIHVSGIPETQNL